MARNRRIAAGLAGLGALLLAGVAVAAPVPATEAIGEALKQDFSPVLRTFLLLSLLSFLPVMLIAVTSFTRIIIVLSLLRHALGIPQTPPNSVLVTLAIFLTLFSMAPVVDVVNRDSLQPYLTEEITATQALDLAVVPLRDFMVRQTRESDLQAVLQMAGAPPPRSVDDISMTQLIPAYLLSELKTAFQIGFVIFLPFLMVDLVVAAGLMALGMIMVPPTTVSLPLKILLFILIDGWVLIAHALLNSYMT
jgi:flagellar biosynthetic protein FliP